MSNISGSVFGAPVIAPETMFAGNLLPSGYYKNGENKDTMHQRHSTISAYRKSNKSVNSSFQGKNMFVRK